MDTKAKHQLARQILKSSFREDRLRKNLKSLSSHHYPAVKHLGSQIGWDDIPLIFEMKVLMKVAILECGTPLLWQSVTWHKWHIAGLLNYVYKIRLLCMRQSWSGSWAHGCFACASVSDRRGAWQSGIWRCTPCVLLLTEDDTPTRGPKALCWHPEMYWTQKHEKTREKTGRRRSLCRYRHHHALVGHTWWLRGRRWSLHCLFKKIPTYYTFLNWSWLCLELKYELMTASPEWINNGTKRTKLDGEFFSPNRSGSLPLQTQII